MIVAAWGAHGIHQDRVTVVTRLLSKHKLWCLGTTKDGFPRHAFYARLPWLFGPLFVAEAPFRLAQEVKAAFPDTRSRLRYVRQQVWTSLSAPASLSRMAAARARADSARAVGAESAAPT